MTARNAFCQGSGAACVLLALWSLPFVAHGQAISDAVDVVTVHSQNGAFYLRSIPFDREEPSPRGVTRVYATGQPEPLYEFDRGFDAVERDSNNLVLSDDGQVIFHAITWAADDEREGMKSITIYKQGRIHRSYTEAEVNGCDAERERCSLVYSNYGEVVDREKSGMWPNYQRVFKEGVPEEEKFLNDFALFSNGDTVYLTDSKKRTHQFDLQDGVLTRSDSFTNLYEELKTLARFTQVEIERYRIDLGDDELPFKGGDTGKKLASNLGMKIFSYSRKRDRQYRSYSIRVEGNLLRDGRFEVEEVEADEGIPREKLIEFFESSRFDVRRIPAVFDKWYVEEYFYFRKSNARLARSERQEELAEERREHQRRLTAKTIDGIYIPANLGEALAELDKLLPQVVREEMRTLPDREDMIEYHFGLGTALRNSWGLWGGSRLQKYFIDRGVSHPDSMSGVILDHYFDWLRGESETWQQWEKNTSDSR